MPDLFDGRWHHLEQHYTATPRSGAVFDWRTGCYVTTWVDGVRQDGG